MKIAKLLHNPGAGEGEHSKEELISLIESAGYHCSYSSTKKRGWEKIEAEELDLLALAGGDGTVRKVADQLLDRKLLDKKLPIGLIPLGTANNIAKTLGIHGTPEEIVKTWDHNVLKKYDVGRIYGMEEAKFFLEGFGFGVFPRLMKAMKLVDKNDIDTPEKSIQVAVELLYKLILEGKALGCKIRVNDIDYSGKFLLVEVMNIRSIGPNLHLAPWADPSDGDMEVVLISESQREEFANYVLKKIKGEEEPCFFNILKTKKLEIFCEGTSLHVDDKLIKIKEPEEVRIELLEGLLEFLVP